MDQSLLPDPDPGTDSSSEDVQDETGTLPGEHGEHLTSLNPLPNPGSAPDAQKTPGQPTTYFVGPDLRPPVPRVLPPPPSRSGRDKKPVKK